MGSGSIAAGMNNGANTPLPLPVPQPQVPTVPAPGQRGPKGLAGRQTYSRVNTGAPQSADAGAYAQKSIPPAGAETTKTSEVNMSIAARPTIQDMMKAAMAGTASAAGTAVSRIKVAEEAKRQLDSEDDEPKSKKKKKMDEGEEDKASAERAEKLASAVEFCADLIEKNAADLAGSYTLTETPMAPGKGPNALEISETPSLAPVNQKPTGQAVSGNQPPMNPATQKAMPQERGGTQLDNDADRAPAAGDPPMSGSTKNASAKLARVMKVAKDKKKEPAQGAPGPQGLTPITAGIAGTALGNLPGGIGAYYGSQKAQAAGMDGTEGAVRGGLGGVLGYGAGAGLGMLGGAGLGAGLGAIGGNAAQGAAMGAGIGGIGGGILGAKKGYGLATEKYAGSVRRIRMLKHAEDAGSPSSIAAGPVQQDHRGCPHGVLDSSEAGPPAQDKGKVPVGHDATRAFTRAEAKATPKKEMKAVLDEPMMSSRTDKVLDVNLDHDGDSKISSVQEVTKIAAARALLKKVRSQAEN